MRQPLFASSGSITLLPIPFHHPRRRLFPTARRDPPRRLSPFQLRRLLPPRAACSLRPFPFSGSSLRFCFVSGRPFIEDRTYFKNIKVYARYSNGATAVLCYALVSGSSSFPFSTARPATSPASRWDSSCVAQKGGYRPARRVKIFVLSRAKKGTRACAADYHGQSSTTAAELASPVSLGFGGSVLSPADRGFSFIIHGRSFDPCTYLIGAKNGSQNWRLISAA